MQSAKYVKNTIKNVLLKSMLLIIMGKHTIFRLDAHYSQTYFCAITQ